MVRLPPIVPRHSHQRADKNRRASLTFEDAARKVHAEHIEQHAESEKHRANWINSLRG